MPTATAMPCSTPSRATLRNATRASTKSERRCRRSRRSPAMSASESDAAMTTAASAGCGRLRSRPGATSSMTTIAAAPTSPVTWVRAPLWKATAVRDPLVLTGKPWKNPAAMLAAPTPTISRFPSISAPVLSANTEAVEMVSVRETREMPSAPANSRPRSLERHGGEGERWEPGRQLADEGDTVVRRGRTRRRQRSRGRRRRERSGRSARGAGGPGSAPGMPRRPPARRRRSRRPGPPWRTRRLRRSGRPRRRRTRTAWAAG